MTCWSFLTSKKAGDGGDVLQPELLHDLGERPDLDAVLRAPAQQREVVDHRLGEVALGREVGTDTASLRFDSFWRPSFTSIGRWANTSGRSRGRAHRARQQVLRRAVDVVLAAHDVGDAHGGVVDRRSTSRNIGMPLERSSTKSSIVLFSKLTSPRTRSSKLVAPSSGTRNRSAVASLCAEPAVAAEAVVPGRAAALLGPGLHLLARAVAPVRPALGQQRAGRPRGGASRLSPGTRSRRPSRGPASAAMSRMFSTSSGRLRSRSVSSTRRSISPPVRRASSQLNRAVRALPTCR